MKEKLTNNLTLKVLSVFLAFFIWLAVVNISNPDIEGTKEVPLEVENESVLKASGKTYELLNDKNTVTVEYKVRTLDSGSVSASDFRAYIDLADMWEPTGSVPVKVESKNSRIKDVTARPGVIRVQTEDIQRKPFDISVKYEGTEEDGYQHGAVTISPSYVYVSGPVSLVGQISNVGIVINIDGANSDLSGSAQVECFDANGNQITNLDDRVTLSRSDIDYTLPILKTKNLSLVMEPEGRVADGYKYTGIETGVNSVSVVGLKSTLADISSITIPKSELNIDGATEDKTVTLDLTKYLPEGVQLADKASSELTIVIKVEQLETRTFQVPVEDIRQVGASSHLLYEYDRNTVNVQIEGLAEDLDQLSEDSLGAEMDVSNMTVGVHAGTITFQLGDAYELIGYDQPQITVRERTAAVTETTEDQDNEEAAQEAAGTASGEAQ